jgi:hypothetical protein
VSRFLLFFLLLLSFFFFGALSIFLGQAWAEGKGKLAMSRHRADSGGETVKKYAAIVYIS